MTDRLAAAVGKLEKALEEHAGTADDETAVGWLDCYEREGGPIGLKFSDLRELVSAYRESDQVAVRVVKQG